MVKKDISKPPRGKPPLPLSLTETGALATAPLSTVVNAATDDLYQDIYNLVHSDIKIVSVANSNATANNNTGGEGDNTSNAAGTNNSTTTTANNGENAVASVEEKLTAAAALGVNDSSTNNNNNTNTTANTNPSNPNDAILETRKQRMSNLSFAQRRHELTRRIVQHTKSIAHVYALTASSLPKSHSAILQQNALKNNHTSSSLFTEPNSPSGTGVKIFDPPPRLGATVQVSSDALQYVKSGWVSQDEAQDALYFHHDGLWKARSHCHDVLGALCVLSTPADNESRVKGADGDAMEIDNDTTKAIEGWHTN